MADLQRQLHEDKALRDAAKALISADIQILKGDLDPKPAASNALDTAKAKAREAADKSSAFVSDNKVPLASLAGLAVLAFIAWFFRDHLKDMISAAIAAIAEPDGGDDRSDTETDSTSGDT